MRERVGGIERKRVSKTGRERKREGGRGERDKERRRNDPDYKNDSKAKQGERQYAREAEGEKYQRGRRKAGGVEVGMNESKT